MDILKEIIENKKLEVAEKKKEKRISILEQSPYFEAAVRSLKQSIEQKEFGIIAEFKRKSPSKGQIIKDLTPLYCAETYQKSGAAGMSILTDFTYFGGKSEDLTKVREETAIPLLRKDFIIDEYQIFEAKALGADCILLIAEALEKRQLHEFTIIAKSLGLEVLMELHTLDQLEKFNEEIDILGVNNRDLKKQQTNIQASLDLYNYLPKEVLKISESGIYTANDIALLAQKGYQGALIGTSILESANTANKLEELVKGIRTVTI